MRYFLEIAYKGTRYSGWQVQHNALSVQQVLNEALSNILRQPVSTTGSGRTDTGVHAEQQFVHLDTAVELDPQQHRYRFNRILPADISVLGIYPVPDQAHARFSATARTYEYRISIGKNPFLTELSHQLTEKPDLYTLQQAANLLLDEQDFSSFCKAHSATPHYLCDITEALWFYQKPDLLVFKIRANRFLRGMVRLVVGTLLDAGRGKITLSEFKAIIDSRNCAHASSAAPAPGLFLTRVEYPAGILPAP